MNKFKEFSSLLTTLSDLNTNQTNLQKALEESLEKYESTLLELYNSKLIKIDILQKSIPLIPQLGLPQHKLDFISSEYTYDLERCMEFVKIYKEQKRKEI